MERPTRARVLSVSAAVLGAGALVLAGASVWLVRTGAYPPPGTGSLGHVGIVVAGVAAGFLSLILGGLALWCLSNRNNTGKLS